MKNRKYTTSILATMLIVIGCSTNNNNSSNQTSGSSSVSLTMNLGKVENINYAEGILSFDEVKDANGYDVKFMHFEDVVYEDKIQDTAIDVEGLGIAGSIEFEVYAYNDTSRGETSKYTFTVLSHFEDVTFEAEDNLYNFGTGKAQSNFRNNPGASKGAYVGGTDDAGQGVYINYLCPIAGTYTLEAYYTAEDVPAHHDVWVNGSYQARYTYTENTGYGGASFNVACAEVEVTLKEGWNTISVYKNGDASDKWGSFAELDYFVLKGNGAEYNVDDLKKYGERPDYYRLEAEMGSPRKKDPSSLMSMCKNPAIKEDATNKYSNGFLLGGIELQYDGVSWHFNSPVKATYELTIAYASGEFTGSKLARPSFIVTQEEVSLAKNADFKKYECVTMNSLPYTGWNKVTVAEQKVQVTLEAGKNFINCLLLTDVNNVDSGFFQVDYVDMKYLSEVE